MNSFVLYSLTQQYSLASFLIQLSYLQSFSSNVSSFLSFCVLPHLSTFKLSCTCTFLFLKFLYYQQEVEDALVILASRLEDEAAVAEQKVANKSTKKK